MCISNCQLSTRALIPLNAGNPRERDLGTVSIFCVLVSIFFWSTCWGLSTEMCIIFIVYIRQYLVVWWGTFNSSKCLQCIIFFCSCSPVPPFSIHSGVGYGTKICLPFCSHWLQVNTGAVYYSVLVIARRIDIHMYTHRIYVYQTCMESWFKPLTKT